MPATLTPAPAAAQDQPLFYISEDRIDAVTTALAKLNKRAAKLGCPPVRFTILRQEWKVVYIIGRDIAFGNDPASVPVRVRYHVCTVAGESPRVEGWQFVAKLEREAEGLNLIRSFEGAPELPEQFRNAAPTCEHCRQNRRRVATFVLRHVESGQYAQIGSACLKDFTGHKSPEAIAQFAGLVLGFVEGLYEDEDARQYNGPIAWHIEEVLRAAAAVVRVEGAFKSLKSGPDYTAGTVEGLLSPADPGSERGRERAEAVSTYAVSAEDEEFAALALTWARTLYPKNDFLHNLKAVASGEVVPARNINLAVAIYGAWHREYYAALLAQRRPDLATGPVSEYVGKPTERLDLVLTVTECKSFEGDFGPSLLYKFADAAGNVLSWFTSAYKGLRSQEAAKRGLAAAGVGDTLKLRGTVKAHREYKGTKETQLTRVEWAPGVAEAIKAAARAPAAAA